jgi:hypothetical protein
VTRATRRVNIPAANALALSHELQGKQKRARV